MATTNAEQYQALLAVSEAIVANRDLPSLLHDLTDRLRQVVSFDYLTVVLHEAATGTMRMHAVDPPEPVEIVLRCEDDPAGLVWQNQQPLVVSCEAELKPWPRLRELPSRSESRATAGCR